MIPAVVAPTFRPPHQTAYEARVLHFVAVAPCCGRDVLWTATPSGETPGPCSCEVAA